MKNIKKISLLFVATVLLLTSCNKNGDIIESLKIEETVALVVSSLQKSTAGLTDEIEKLAEESVENYSVSLTCDTIYQDNYDLNYNNTLVSANYSVNYSFEMECNEISIPQSLTFSASSIGDYSTPRIESVDSSSSSLYVEGLQPTQENLTFSGSFIREGTQYLTVLESRNVSSEIKFTFNEIIVSKETNFIESGQADLQLTGIINNGETFVINGSIIFTGNRTATLTINGEVYELDLN